MISDTLPSLLLIGHGSTETMAAKTALASHMGALNETGRYASIQTYFLSDGLPLPRLPEGIVYLVPFFMSNGYFSGTKIRSLFEFEGNSQVTETRTLLLCKPVGVQAEVIEIIRTVLEGECLRHSIGAADLDVLLVAHGSSKSAASEEAARFFQRQLQDLELYSGVRVGFLEERPYLFDWIKGIPERAKMTIAVGLFAADGPHSIKDVPEMLVQKLGSVDGIEPKQFYTGAIGCRPEMVNLIEKVVADFNK